MEYKKLAQIFASHEAAEPKYHLDGYITFSNFGAYEDSNYTQLDRTYIVSSNNKAYKPNCLGFSIFGSCLNGRDPCVRLESYIQQPNGWTIGECCLLQYQLQCINERELLEPQMFPTLRQATEAMVDSLCRHSGLDFPKALCQFDRHGCRIDEESFSIDQHTAYLNDGRTGNWDWKILPIRIYSLTHIAVGDLDVSKDTEAGGV